MKDEHVLFLLLSTIGIIACWAASQSMDLMTLLLILGAAQ
jgi:hypothetical protein